MIAELSARPRSLGQTRRHDTIAASHRSMNVHATKCWRPILEMSAVPEDTARSGSNRVACPIIGARERGIFHHLESLWRHHLAEPRTLRPHGRGRQLSRLPAQPTKSQSRSHGQCGPASQPERRLIVTAPRLHYDVHESDLPDAPALLLVHGMYSARSHWLLNLAGLRQFTRPVVVELLGHGRSPSPSDEAAYHPDSYVQAFESIRQAVGADRWLMCGQSLGGALTLRYALSHPERVIAQAFTNSNSAMADAEWGEQLRARITAELQQHGSGDQASIANNPLNPANNQRLPPHLRAAFAADVELHEPEGLTRTSLNTLGNSSLSERLSELRVPTLLVVGTRERRFAPGRKLAEKQIPGLEVVELDAGHAVNLDRPDEFNAALRRFFERVLAEQPRA